MRDIGLAVGNAAPDIDARGCRQADCLRYYIRVAGNIVWVERPEELMQYLPQPRELPPGFELPRPISYSEPGSDLAFDGVAALAERSAHRPMCRSVATTLAVLDICPD